MGFSGFKREAFDFLVDVRGYNSKEWYEENKPVYKELLLKPFQELVTELAPVVLEIDRNFEVKPAVDKTISRIYRDTRFSKDKSRYRENMWLTFKRNTGEWKEAPCFYFEIMPGKYRYGMGYYSATRDSMDTMRKMIDEKPEEFLKATECMRISSRYSVEGDSYKRKLKETSPEIEEWYNRKNLYIVHNSSEPEKLYTGEIVEELKEGFKELQPVYDYLLKVEERKIRRE